MSLFSNLRKRGFKDILRPKKWAIYARYLKLKALKKEYEELSIPEYREQIVFRMTQPGCRPCIDKGECVHCGCKSPEVFFDKTNECSGLNWFTMMPPKEWNKYKKDHGVKIDPFYISQLKKYGTVKVFKNGRNN